MFFQISPVRRPAKPKVEKKNDSEEISVLSLGPFAAQPKIFFENIVVGQSATRKLLIKNPTPRNIPIFLNHTIPDDLKITFNWQEQEISSQTEILLEIGWTPDCECGFRFVFVLQDNKRLRVEVPLILKSVLPKGAKPKKKLKAKSPAKKVISTRRVSPVKTKKPIRKMATPPSSREVRYSSRAENVLLPPPNTKRTLCVDTENKENLPFRLHGISPDPSPIIINERRQTYTLNSLMQQKTIDPEVFNDSLEMTSPTHSLDICRAQNGILKPRTFNNLENTEDPSFAYKLQSTSFKFSPTTPIRSRRSDPNRLDYIRSSEIGTYDMSTIHLNISTETYVKDNASFETYVKDNTSEGTTFVMDSSIGDVSVLPPSPTLSQHCLKDASVRHQSLSGIGARNIIEAGMWSFKKPDIPVSSQSEKTTLSNINNASERRPVKRKTDIETSISPLKRIHLDKSYNTIRPSLGWSGSHQQLSKSISNLSLNKLWNSEQQLSVNRSLRKAIVTNPFLFAAVNMVDPFMTAQVYHDDEWIEKQINEFKKWLNALLTPPVELSTVQDDKIDVAKVWQDVKNKEVAAAPTKESLSNKYHTQYNKLNSLRKSAQMLFRSEPVGKVLAKVVLAVETGKLSLRDDRDVTLNLTVKGELTSLLLSYNTLWLRIGLETIYNEEIPLSSNSDVTGLTSFIMNRFFKDPNLLRRYKSMHNPKYMAQFKKLFLKKFLILVYFLDQAKTTKLIAHDPCLFRRNAHIKESKEILISLARESLAAIGDINKFLKYCGYVVTHKQTYLNEFDYAVNNLGVDLRDGVRLTKVMEIILLKDGLTTHLRVPAISRLQKVHNMEIVFNSLKGAGFQILWDIEPKDIVDGHKEKTLSLLWQIIYKFEAPLMTKSCTTIQTWFRSLPVVLKRRKLERIRLQKIEAELKTATVKVQQWWRSLILMRSERKHYLKLKIAAILVQTRFRAQKLMQQESQNYQALRKNVLFVQQHYRANKAMQTDLDKYTKLKIATIKVQQWWRSLLLMRTERKQYLTLRNATMLVQTRFRAQKLMQQESRNYLVLIKNVFFVQQHYRANKAMQTERDKYSKLKTATNKVQQWWRSIILMRAERKQYLILRNSAILMQNRFRAQKLMEQESRNYQALRKNVIFVQRHYRANKAMQSERDKYIKLKTATIKIQQWWRSLILMRPERKQYVILRNAAIFVQTRFRAQKLMQQESRNYQVLRKNVLYVQQHYRANKAMQTEHDKYTKLKIATIKVQQWWRSLILMRAARNQYLTLKNSTILVQTRFRAQKLMQQESRNYQALRKSVLFIQQHYRANKAMQIEHDKYTKLKIATIKVQQWWRSVNLMRAERKLYLTLKNAIILVQSRFRAQKLMQQESQNYQALRKNVLFVQQHYRANKAMRRERDKYSKLKTATIKIQQWWRSLILMRLERKQYLTLKNATILVQTRFRAQKLMQQESRNYQALRKNVLFVQQHYRANKAMQTEHDKYTKLKIATIKVQQWWRSVILMRTEFKQYLTLRNVTVLVQSRFRAQKLMQQESRNYQALRKNVLFVQQHYRANKAMQTEHDKYTKLKIATIKVQQWWRSVILMRTERKQYLTLRNVTVLVQSRFRAQKLMQQESRNYQALRKNVIFVQRHYRANKAMQTQRDKYSKLKSATIKIQQWWRSVIMMRAEHKQYLTFRNAAILMQTRFRAQKLMQQESRNFQVLRKNVLFVQQHYRANKAMQTEHDKYTKLKIATIKIQQWWRSLILMIPERKHYLAIRRLKKMQNDAAIKIQATWKGYKTRSIESSSMDNIRTRLDKANTEAYKNPETTLKHRCTKAIEVLMLDHPSLMQLIRALKDIDYVTRRCKTTCQKLGSFMPDQLYLLISCTARSLPEMDVCTLASSIIINFCKLPETRSQSFIDNYMDNITTVMINWCDKEAPLFPHICTLLWLFAHHNAWRQVILNVPNVQQKLVKIKSLVYRKQKMVERTGIKGTSYFAPFTRLPLPSTEPDWGLEYTDNPNVFKNSIHALNCFLEILRM